MFLGRQQGKGFTKAGAENVDIGETLNCLERALHFGSSKLSLQRLVFVNELVDCAHEIGYDATVVHLLPLVSKLASDPEVLVRQSLVGHFGDLAGFLIQSDPEKGYQKVVDDLLPVISLLLAEKATDVRQGAADALTTLASHLRPGERGFQVLMKVISLSHNNEDEDARGTAVQLLNSLAEALGPDLCKQFVAVELVALCEDPALRVRKATAASFAEVSRIVGEDHALKRLIPAYAQLVHDSHWGVRKAAAESMVSFAMSVSATCRKESFVPLVDTLLIDSSRWVRLAALQQLGYFIAALEVADRVPASLLKQYVDVIQQSKGNPDAADISFHCAYTFAAVCKTIGKGGWQSLKAAFLALCTDAQMKTRKALAASLHIVAQTLGAKLLEKEVLLQLETFLQDSVQEVRHAALKQVSQIAEVASELSGTAVQRKILIGLQSSMTKAENWRLRQLVASQLGPICSALVAVPDNVKVDSKDFENEGNACSGGIPRSSLSREEQDSAIKDLTWSVIVPLFIRLCTDTVAQVREEASKAAASLLRAAAPEMFLDPQTSGAQEEGSSGCSSGPQQPLSPATTRFIRQLIKSFARSRCFRGRMSFIRMCDSIIREAPLHIFSELFLRPLIRLATDKVKNVRLCWANIILPHVRHVGRLGQNIQVIAAATRLMRQSAKDVVDPEVERLLVGAQLPEVSEEALSALPGPESDLDEPDAGESCLSTEGGTGDSSECGEDEAFEVDNTASSSSSSRQEPSAKEEAASQSLRQSSEVSLSSFTRRVSPAALQFEEDASASSRSQTSPLPASLSLLSPQAPRSPLQGPTAAPGHDAVEDFIVQQVEIERDIDAAFSDHRLLVEAEAEAESSPDSAAELGIDRVELVEKAHSSPLLTLKESPSGSKFANLEAANELDEADDNTQDHVLLPEQQEVKGDPGVTIGTGFPDSENVHQDSNSASRVVDDHDLARKDAEASE